MNRYVLLFVFITFFLAACDAGPDGGYDPAAIAGAEAVLSAATQSAIATRGARLEEDRQQRLAAARDKSESEAQIALIDKEMQATRQAFDLETTASVGTAVAQSAFKTEVARVQSTAEAGRLTATPAYATQVAITNQIELERKKEDIRLIAAWGWAIAGPIALIIFAVALVIFLNRALNMYIEWRDRKERIYDTRGGTVVWDWSPESGVWIAQLLVPRYTNLTDGTPAARKPNALGPVVNVTKVTPSGSVLSSPMRNNVISMGANDDALARNLVEAAIKVNGESSNQIPRWDKLNMGSSVWQRGKAVLEGRGLVASKENEGTYVVDGDLGDLLYEIETRRMSLTP